MKILSDDINPDLSGIYKLKDFDENNSIFRWKIENVTELNEKIESDTIYVGGYPWKILVYLLGSQSTFFSAFLVCPDAKKFKKNETRFSKFQIILLNQNNLEHSFFQDAEKDFNSAEADWGFRDFLPLEKVYDYKEGFFLNNTLYFDIIIHVGEDEEDKSQEKDGKYNGLINQGATCYMNSLLQTLFHLKIFRDLVFSIPITNDNRNAPFALQKLFYHLKYEKEEIIETTELTKSFGWDNYDSFRQHDVQEFCRVLMDHLEEKLKKSENQKDKILQIFGGKILNFIECINVDYKSEREENFYDLQLNVKGCSNIYESLDQYTEVEILEGENQYNSETFGLQNAKKGVKFLSLPPVLMFHLKRFEFDVVNYTQYKINDKYEFPIDLDLKKYFNDEQNKLETDYVLFGVLIHSGNVDSGHYYSFIQKEKGQWFKFNDEKVFTLNEESVFKDSFGGELENFPYFWSSDSQPNKFNFTNAYMLVYIKKSDFQNFISDETKYPNELSEIIKKEKIEIKKKEKQKQEEFKFVHIKVIDKTDMKQYHGPDLIDFSKIETKYFVEKTKDIMEVKKAILQDTGIEIEKQHLFKWEKRQNRTTRPSKYLSQLDSTFLKTFRLSNRLVENISIYLHVSPRHIDEKNDYLIFFKYFDSKSVDFITSFIIPKNTHIRDLFELFNKWKKENETDWLVFEEVSANRFEEIIDLDMTVCEADLQSGDILVFQKDLKKQQNCYFKTVGDFVDYKNNKIQFQFRSMFLQPFEMDLSKTMTIDNVIDQLAFSVRAPKDQIRLFYYDTISQTGKYPPISDWNNLSEIQPNIFYFDVLPYPKNEIEKEIFISFLDEHLIEQSTFHFFYKKGAIIKDVLSDIKISLPHLDIDNIRLMKVQYSRIKKIYTQEDRIENLQNFVMLRAEEIKNDELIQNEENEKLIQIEHFWRESSLFRSFDHPFIFKIKKNQTLSEIKILLKEKLQITTFDKFKFGILIGNQKCEYLKDDDNVFDHFEKYNHYKNVTVTLGLEHKDPSVQTKWSDQAIIIK
eukprot:gene3426-5971_t